MQIELTNLEAQHRRLKEAEWPLLMDVEEKWYRTGTIETGVRQFLVQDPDGYLVRLCSGMGQRPAGLQPSRSTFSRE